MPKRQLPRRSPVASGAAVGEALGGVRVPQGASPRGSPLSALLALCLPPWAPGPAWAVARPSRTLRLPVCPYQARALSELGAPPPRFAKPRRPALRGPPGQAGPAIPRAHGGVRGARRRVLEHPVDGSRELLPPPAPARRGAAGGRPHVGKGQTRHCPPRTAGLQPFFPGVAKPPPAGASRGQGALVQFLGQEVGASQMPRLTRHPLLSGTYLCDLLKVSLNF